MASNYPTSLDSFTTKQDGVDDVLASHVNDLQNALVAVQTELGTSPSGTFANVVTRLSTLLQGWTLSNDLDMNSHGLSVRVEPVSNYDYQGVIASMTVDVNAEGTGAPLFMAADGHLETVDADYTTAAPCVALALESGTGSKSVLLLGTLRLDAWNWTTGPGQACIIYASTTAGTLTQTKPSAEDDVIQPVGWALTDDMIWFNPSLIYITHEA